MHLDTVRADLAIIGRSNNEAATSIIGTMYGNIHEPLAAFYLYFH